MIKKSKKDRPMGQALKYTEPTIWALRKNAHLDEQRADGRPASLYEHIFGYEPIRVTPPPSQTEEEIRKGSAENPNLNIINPVTNFIVMELASEEAEDR